VWTRRRRWLAAAGLLLLAAAGWFWWASRPAPLTEEEKRFVGWWRSPDWGKPNPKSLNPVRPTAVEYRADRTIRTRWVNTKTGEVTYTVPDQAWRAVNGELIESYPRPRRDVVVGLPRADLRIRHEYIFEVVWHGPDRYTFERYKIPGFPPPDGRGWPVWERVRCDPPADAP
jgi:hypothetical protein